MKPEKSHKKKTVGRLQMSLLLLFIALASVVAATAAWISIADNGRLQSMSIDVTAGISMKFDLDPHPTIDEYLVTLSFDDIAARIQSELGFDMKATPLEPVTSTDAETFSLENGAAVDPKDGKFLTFTLHFMAMEDMIVHLTTETANDQEGTIIRSENAQLPQAMRISFTADGKTYIYDPGMGNTSQTAGDVKTFGLPDGGAMTYNDDNGMFALKANENKEVLVHVWLEGNDPDCTDALKGAPYSIALRFQGTDEHNTPVSEEERFTEKDDKRDDKEKYTQRDETADDKEEKEKLTFAEKWQIFWERMLDDY
ncbi:MAG: hypothetical protein Q4B73_01305 [Lachnospiraceae bacterium]|nr:hypothetical protein [Lachnospiraceae bacterium]